MDRRMDEKRQRKLAQAIGAAIAAARERAGLTQDQVADRLGLGPQAVSRVERGTVIPSAVRLYELAEVFDCRVDDLLISASDRAADQALAIARQIQSLAANERILVTGLVSQLTEHLASKPVSKRPRR